jgi:hypothetical protein
MIRRVRQWAKLGVAVPMALGAVLATAGQVVVSAVKGSDKEAAPVARVQAVEAVPPVSQVQPVGMVAPYRRLKGVAKDPKWDSDSHRPRIMAQDASWPSAAFEARLFARKQ